MIEDILLWHFSMYPQMEPQDAVKLIYQQAFGAEHMIKAPEKSLAMLKTEMAGLQKGPVKEPLYEPIGNGLCRLNLRPCKERGIPAEDINRLFLETAQSFERDKRLFHKGMAALKQLAEDCETPFSALDLDIYLIGYPQKPAAVHHSPRYREAYAPAYRVVVQKKLKKYLAGLRKETE